MKTEAFVLRAPDVPMQLESVFLDEPKQDEVMVAIAAAGLCRSDLHAIAGHDGSPMPIVLGHEAVGVVEKLGAGVSGLQVGERVILSWVPACGICRPCCNGRPALCTVAANCCAAGELPGGGVRLRDKHKKPIHHYSSVASFARHAVVPASGCVPLHAESITSESAAAIGCATMTGVGAAINSAKVQPGESVVVFGLGGVGLNVLQGARLSDAAVIVGVDVNPSKRDIAQKFGATHFVEAGQKNTNSTIIDICGTGGANVTFDALGHPDIIRDAFDTVCAGGRVVCVGLSPGEKLEIKIPANTLVSTEKSIIGCFYGGANPIKDFPMLVNLFCHGRLLLDELVEEIIPFEDIANGVARMQSGTLVGRLVAQMN